MHKTEDFDKFRNYLGSEHFLGDRLVSASFSESGRGLNLDLEFIDGWGVVEKRFYYLVGSRKRKINKPFKQISIMRNGKKERRVCVYKPDTSMREVLRGLSKSIMRYVARARSEKEVFEFFMEVSKNSDYLGEPVWLSEEERREHFVDLLVPVLKKNVNGYFFVPIKVKTDLKYWKRAVEMNRKNKSRISTLCFSSKEDLLSNKALIEGKVRSHGRRALIFNLNLSPNRKSA
jgi:hypothetical protein